MNTQPTVSNVVVKLTHIVVDTLSADKPPEEYVIGAFPSYHHARLVYDALDNPNLRIDAVRQADT